MQKHKGLALVTAVALIIGLLAIVKMALIRQPEPLPAKQVALPTVTVPVPAAFTRFIATIIQINSFDTKSGVKINFIEVPQADLSRALIQDKTNISLFTPLESARLQTEGYDVITYSPVLSLSCPIFGNEERQKVTNLNQLDGKRVGYISRTSGCYLINAILLKREGKDIEQTYHVVVGTAATLPVLLAKGDLDYVMALSDEIGVYKMIKQPNVFHTGYSLGKMLPAGVSIPMGLTAKTEWLKNHQKEALAVKKAYDLALTYLKDHPEIYSNPAIMKLFQLKQEDVKEITQLRSSIRSYENVNWEKTIEFNTAFVKQAVESSFLKEYPSRPFIGTLEK